MTAIALHQVTRTAGAEIHIPPTSLELAAGSLNILLGPTRGGKTTLMRLLAGLDRPTTGRVLVDGVDVTDRSIRERDVAMVYQQFINYPSFTVYDDIASPLRRAGVPRDQLDRRVRQVPEMLHIEPFLDRLPAELSGGQQPRTALARALVKEAGLLLLDEPLVNLDYKLREELRLELRATSRPGHRSWCTRPPSPSSVSRGGATNGPAAKTSTSRCPAGPRGTWPSRSSGTRPSPPPW